MRQEDRKITIMFVSKKEFNNVQERHSSAIAELIDNYSQLMSRHKRLLQHLGLEEYRTPATWEFRNIDKPTNE